MLFFPFYLFTANGYAKREKKKIEKQIAAYKTMIFETIIEETAAKLGSMKRKTNCLLTHSM